MKNTFLKSSCFVLLVVVAFVYFANPIYAKASTADMDYIETDMTTSEVAQLFAVPAAFLPAAIVIIGFIVLTYCTLRNVQVPVSYSSQASFLDKCTQLGQYVVDNITDPIKDFLYSVYTYAQDNNLTSITGIAAFTAVHIGQFFHAIGLWINGSLINNVSSIGQGLLSNFSTTFFANLMSEMTASTQTFLDHSDIVPTFLFDYHQGSNDVVYGLLRDSTFSLSNSYLVAFNNGFQLYTLENDNFFISIANLILISTGCNYYSPSVVSYTSGYNSSTTRYRLYPSGVFVFNSYYCRYGLTDLMSFILSLGITNIHYIDDTISSSSSIPSSISLSDTSVYRTVVTSPWSDQIYQPSDDELEIDPDGIGEVLGGAVAGLTLGELINLLTQGKTLTLDSALESQKIVGGGDYVFPSMDGIWKYPQYFYDMLKGWGSFVGGCLSAVTVGDGGLSWIFYGGFVLLICGGIIGKILLG